jgi:NAD(P)H dehydrogenase (quinone)
MKETKTAMNVLIVYAHPEPTSFNAALKDAAVKTIQAAGHRAEVSDLYAQKFNPVAGRHDFGTVADAKRFHYQSEQLLAAQSGTFSPEIAREHARMEEADLVILQFPLWWGAPPAILKGWFDRILAYGFAYADGRRFDKGLFQGRGGMMCVTTGGTPQRFSSEGEYGEIDRVLWPVKHLTLDYLGLDVEEPFVCYSTPRVDDATRATYLKDWSARVSAALQKNYTRTSRDEINAQIAANASSWNSRA